MGGRTHSRESKLELVRQIATGQKRLAQVCREYQLAEGLLLRWCKEYKERGEGAFSPKRMSGTEALRRRSRSWSSSRGDSRSRIRC